MNYYLDTEFTGLHKNTTLISLALVSEKGDYFYAEFTDYDKSQLNDWLSQNVIANLIINSLEDMVWQSGNNLKIKGDKILVCNALKRWFKNQIHKVHSKQPFQIWTDVGSYDWVLFQDLFGGAMQMPSHINYIPFDIAQTFAQLKINADCDRILFLKENNIDLPIEINQHNALFDARITKMCHQVLQQKINHGKNY